MLRSVLLPLIAIAVLLAGCSSEAALEDFAPPDESALAKELIAKVAAGDFAAVESRLDGKLKTADVRERLQQMHGLLPREAPRSVKTIGAHTHRSSAATTYNLTYEYEYSQRWIVANAVLERRDGQLTLQGIHFVPGEQSLASVHRFTFEGKGWAHYSVFALAIAIPLFIVYALVVCVRTSFPKRKWLWLLFVAVGFVQLQFNWTDGSWGVQPLSFLLLGAGYVQAGPAAPFIFKLAFPLGAVLFMLKRGSFGYRGAA